MAISKVVYKESSNATPVTWMDATGVTAAAGNIITPYTAMVADGTIATGTVPAYWTLLASQEYTVNSTNTSGESVGNIQLTQADIIDPEVPIWVHIRDKAGKRSGYFYGCDAIYINYKRANNSTDYYTPIVYGITYVDSSGNYVMSNITRGVYARILQHTTSNHFVQIYVRYDATYGTINGTFKCDVYKLITPSGFSMFA